MHLLLFRLLKNFHVGSGEPIYRYGCQFTYFMGVRTGEGGALVARTLPPPPPNISAVCHTHVACRPSIVLAVSASSKVSHPLIKQTKLTFDKSTQSDSLRPATSYRHFTVSRPYPIRMGYEHEISSPAMAIF